MILTDSQFAELERQMKEAPNLSEDLQRSYASAKKYVENWTVEYYPSKDKRNDE